MKRDFLGSRGVEGEAFDMTPVIDVVFLLIIFFMLVCQFMAAERFKVDIPEQIASGAPQRSEAHILTLSVLPAEGGVMLYAAGSERLGIENPEDVSALITAAIDDYFRTRSPADIKTVRLRCDKSASFGQIRPVLEAIAKSIATDVDWAVRND